MTNAQMAHKMGLDILDKRFTLDEYKAAAREAGLTIIGTTVTPVLGVESFTAKLEMQYGEPLEIFCGSNGTARIDKPNGTHKWVYEKTPAQIGATLKQIKACYR